MENTKDSFFSMDRLVEFGMGMAMSQQIVQSMNNMMGAMRQPPLAQAVYQGLPVQQGVNSSMPQTSVYQQYAGATQLPVQKAWSVAPQQVSQNPTAFANAGKSVSDSVPPPVSQSTGSVTGTIPPFSEVFFISHEKEKMEGPFSGTEIARLVAEKKVTSKTLVWKAGMKEWKTAVDFPELLALIALVPPELPEQN